MQKLILSFEGTVLKSVAVGTDRITIGRKPENDIQVDNLAVSGFHAAVERVGEDVILEDLHSTNGTIVNGQLIQKHVLKNFDIVELGKHKLKYVVEAASSGNMDKTMVIRRPMVPDPHAAHAHGAHASTASHPPAPAQAAAPARAPTPAPAPAAPAAAAPAPREAAIQVLSGPAAGRVLELTKNLTTIGRPGLQVSVITRRPNGYFITHVEGTGFPLLNGAPLGAQAQQLKEQDTIEIAGTKMSFFYKP
jgi:pSer/pThr/pTyr-binding forkhead associated (FHA) protein